MFKTALIIAFVLGSNYVAPETIYEYEKNDLFIQRCENIKQTTMEEELWQDVKVIVAKEAQE